MKSLYRSGGGGDQSPVRWFDSDVLRTGAVPVLLALLAATGVGFAALAWREGYWTFPGRVHYTLVTAVAVAFVLQLAYWEFLPV